MSALAQLCAQITAQKQHKLTEVACRAVSKGKRLDWSGGWWTCLAEDRGCGGEVLRNVFYTETGGYRAQPRL